MSFYCYSLHATCPGCADLSSRGKGVQGVHQSASECPRKIPKLYGTCEYCGWDHGSPLPILAVSTVLGLHCLGAIQISQPLDQLFNPLRGSHHRRIGRKSTNESSQSGNMVIPAPAHVCSLPGSTRKMKALSLESSESCLLVHPQTCQFLTPR